MFVIIINTIFTKKLKKRQVVLKMAWCELASRPVELVLEGAVEELRKDKKIYQKMAKLQLRSVPQSYIGQNIHEFVC